MFEYYNNTLAIHSSFLYNKDMYDAIKRLEKRASDFMNQGDQESFMNCMLEVKLSKIEYKNSDKTFLTLYSYKAWIKRKKLNKLQSGGNGRVSLIEWDSLGEALKAKVINVIGYDPAKKTKNRTFKESIVHNEEASKFFKNYKKSNGDNMKDYQIAQCIARVNVFDAITALFDERESKRSAFGKSKTTLWKNLAKVINEIPHDEIPHKLPKDYRRLQNPYFKYIEESFTGVLPGGLENDNSKKIKGDVADWLLATYCLPNKPLVPPMVAVYNSICENKGWSPITVNAVTKWLEEPEVKRQWVLARHGKEEYNRQFKHHVSRKRENWFANAYWAIDGSKIDWIHYEDNVLGMAAKLKIDPVVDVFSEKIIGWSYSETESHIDHFTAVKMAMNNTGARPYLFTYDNQSGHKTTKMQELYSNIVAKSGGLHYPNKAKDHNSPVENVFKRLQQQVINQLWFSDKQSPTVRTMDNKPNMDFIKEFKHRLSSKADLIKAWELCVKLWNEAKHPHFEEMTRSQVFEMEAPMREDVSFLEMVDIFWVFNNRKSTYRKGGLSLTVGSFDYEYEVLDSNNRIDIEFRRKHVGGKFRVKYDPEHLNDFIQLYKEDAQGNMQFVANAQPKRKHESIPVLMNEGDKESWKQDYDVRELEYQRDLKAIEKLRMRTGITPEKLIEDQELMIKLGGELPKEQRLELDSVLSRL